MTPSPTPGPRPDPIAEMPRRALGVLGREYLLAGHLIDRASMPQLLAHGDVDVMTQVAIEQWMGASPVYTRRIQRALGFEGGADVPTIFKGLQFDVGAPHQFMDFRYRVLDDQHGEFWLDCCGALMDVEPMGDVFVQAMCHDIEDPTFDATAVATNPQARMRPIHRPPRVPADREPHCHWKVFIDPDAEPLTETELCHTVGRSLAATLDLPAHESEPDDDGWTHYDGDFDPRFELERLSTATLRRVLDEVALQGHLLVRAFSLSCLERFGRDTTEDIVRAQFRGIAPVVADRIATALDLSGDSLGDVATVLRLHPAFRPRAYVDLAVIEDGDRLRLALRSCPALDEGDRHGWAPLLDADGTMLEATVRSLDPRWRCHAAATSGTEVLAWDLVWDPSVDPAEVPTEEKLTRVSTGADFEFRRPLPIV